MNNQMRDPYDIWLVLRAIEEEMVVEAAIIFGILSDYLLADEIDYFYDTPDGWLRDFINEGYNYQRHEHTAEELYIWAHEYDKKALGLKNFFPIPTREPRTP